jgi:uncharacterized protein (UPF0212 family)
VESTQHAQRVAKKEIGGALRDVPLKVIDTAELDSGDDDE